MFNRIGGVQDDIYGEGVHFRCAACLAPVAAASADR